MAALDYTGHAVAAAPPAAVWPPDMGSLASGVPIGEHLPPVLGPLTLLMGGEQALALVGPAGADRPPVALGNPGFGDLTAVASGLVPLRPGLPLGGKGGRVAPGLGE